MHAPASHHGPAGPHVATGGDDARRWWLLGLVGLAQFMLIIDVTVVNVALPSIGGELGLDRALLTWVVTAYTLTFGSLLLLGGRLADAFGGRRVFLAGLTVFTAASLLSGLAPSGELLVAARVAQGIGAALLSPAALSIITTTFHGRERDRALAVWGTLAGTGAAFGVVLGGLLSAGPGWQWIFFVNVPVGVAVGLAARRLVPNPGPGRTGQRIDALGAVTAVLAVGLFLWAVIGAGDPASTSVVTVLAFGGSILAGALFAWIETRAADPLLRPGLLRTRGLAGSVTVFTIASALLGSSFFLSSLYMQGVLGLSAFEAGLAFLPGALGTLVGAQLAGAAIGHAGPRLVAAAGLAIAAAGAGLLAGLPGNGDLVADFVPGYVLLAIGSGMAIVAATTGAFGHVAQEEAGMASGVVNTSHELGLSLGVGLASAVVGGSLAGVGSATGFAAAFGVAGIVAAAAIGVAWIVMPARAPAGHGRLATGH